MAAWMTVQTIGPAAARRTALAAQGFADLRPTGPVTRRHLLRVLGRIRLPGAFAEPGIGIADTSRVVAELARAQRELAQWLELDGIAMGPRGDLAAALGTATRHGSGPVRTVPR